MPATELTLFSLEILGLVGRDGAGAHDLRRMAQQGRMLAWAGESQYYTEPKRLAKLGYLDAREERGKTRQRTVYTLTDKGLEALREYARRPATLSPLKSDALLRLLICDLVGEGVTRQAIGALRDDLADIAVRLDDAERRAHDLPHRERYLLLATAFLRRFIDLHEELIQNVERQLAGDDTPEAHQPHEARRTPGQRVDHAGR